MLDTRQAGTAGAGALGVTAGSRVPAGGSISVKVTGGDVPDSALAVALNVTAVDAEGPGYLTIFPDGGPQPGTSSVNFPPGAPSPNAVVAKVGTGGRVRIFANAGVDVIVDMFGWFGRKATSAVHGSARSGPRHRRRRTVEAGKRSTSIAGTAQVPSGHRGVQRHGHQRR